jgi:glutamyl-tRNA reductase
MRVGVVGINFKSSDLSLRELLAKAFERCFARAGHLNAVLLMTCNRTELYFSGEDLPEMHSEILAQLRRVVSVPFEHKLYSYFGGECFTHLAKVVSGFDSAILGETEIQRQVKLAYSTACLRTALPSCLHFMFQKCLKIGKWVRTTMPMTDAQAGLETLIFQLIRLLLPENASPSLLFIGNSEINRKILSYIRSKGIDKITLCTRALHNANELGVHTVSWEELPHWHSYEIVISGTIQHQDYLLSSQTLPEEPQNRLIFDLSVPRNVDPLLKRHPKIHLYNIEELSWLIDHKRRISHTEIQQVEACIRHEAEKQLFLFQNKEKKVCANF